MNILEFLITPAEASRQGGPHDRIVFSSRVRLARNLTGVPFPGHARKADRVRVYEQLAPAVAAQAEMGSDALADSMDHFTALEKQVLVERHLISREHAARSAGAGLVLNRSESL